MARKEKYSPNITKSECYHYKEAFPHPYTQNHLSNKPLTPYPLTHNPKALLK